MKLCYRVRHAEARIRGLKQLAEKEMAAEAIKYLGKELNTSRAWKTAGEIEALKSVIDILSEEDILYQ